jgi:Icc protein
MSSKHLTIPVSASLMDRRQAMKGMLMFSSSVLLPSPGPVSASNGSVTLDPNHIALLADTHISENPQQVVYGTRWPGAPYQDDEHEDVNMAACLRHVIDDIIAQNPPPAHVVINGDCAYSNGCAGEYKEFARLIEPLHAAGITVHVTIGNHDNRTGLWEVMPELKREALGVQTTVVELPKANLMLLDSGVGKFAHGQLDWLDEQLHLRPDKTALVFAHFNPLPHQGIRPLQGMRDGEGRALLELMDKHKHAKAFFHGHTHKWKFGRWNQIHLINQPAVGYYFGKGHAHGWVSMKLTDIGANLQLRCVNEKHAAHQTQHQLLWRTV